MRWDNDIYRTKFGFKVQHGLELAAQVKPVRGKLLELGSETGILSYQLWKLEYQVEGIEFDSRLVDMARRTTAKSVFFEAFTDDVMLYEDTYPMAIANDVIHRIPAVHQEDFLNNLYRSMKQEGQMAFDMGVAGNNEAIEDALRAAFEEEGRTYKGFYYPDAEEYQNMLRRAGFTIEYVRVIERPEKVSGEDAMEWYIEMFCRDMFRRMDDDTVVRIVSKAVNALKPQLFDGEKWTIPGVRMIGKVVK